MNRVEGGDVLNYEMLQLQKEDVVESRTTSLHSTVVIGAEYELLDKWLAIGALSTTRFTKPKTQTEITLSANIRPKSWLNAAISYSMIQSAGKSFWFGCETWAFVYRYGLYVLWKKLKDSKWICWYFWQFGRKEIQ